MLRQTAELCRSVLFRGGLDPLVDAQGSIHVQYAACSVVKAFTANLHGIAVAQAKQQRHLGTTSPAAAAEAAASTNSEGLVIHDSAVRRLKELQAESPDKGVKLRVEVEGGGCSGFQYKFRLDDSQTAADDIVFEREGVQVVCDTVSMDFLRGAVVEFEDNLMRSAFQIASNPNSESTCGCGTSFVAKM